MRKHIKLLSFVVVFALLLTAQVVPVVGYAAEVEYVTFEDGNLRAAVVEAVYEATGTRVDGDEDITKSQASKVEKLDLSGKGITNIEGIEALENLKALALNNNQVSNISALSGLTKMEILLLDNNGLTDITPLNTLVNMQALSVANNKITKLDATSNMTKLVALYAHKNQISDVTPLADLTKLKELVLAENSISDISKLSKLTNLELLLLDINDIENIDSLKTFSKLKLLGLSENRLDSNANSAASKVVATLLENRTIVDTKNQKTTTPTNRYISSGTTTASTETVTKPEEEVPSAAISDITGHWAEKYILKLKEKGIITGYTDKTFKPDNAITRAEAAVIMSKLFGLKEATEVKLNFADKAEIPVWAAVYVQTAFDGGIITGYPDNTFKASNEISREEFVAIIIRAAGFKNVTAGNTNFKDDDKIWNWSKGFVKKAVELGLTNGYTDGTFKPSGKITRAEVCAICVKYLESK